MTILETRFKSKYPVLFDFMETTLWPDVDGFNPIALLHQMAYYGHPEYSKNLIDNLKAISQDDSFENEEISSLFNREEIGHPYEVVNPGNAKDFCFSMSEALVFIVSLKK
jgi:hypothetical protein